MIKPIQILSDVISTTAHTVNISSIVDNLDGTYTLLVDNTYYLHDASKITINSNDYRVKSFILNNTLVITGTVLPVVSDFVLPSPLFIHGTPQKISGERHVQNTKEYPFIWLLEFLEANYDDSYDSSITTTLDLNLFFLTDINFDNWDIDVHYTQSIDPMANEIDFIIKVIQKRRDLFGEITSHKVTNHVNFGEYITNKGNKTQILTDQVSGCSLKLSLPYVVDVCNDSTVVVSKCLPVTITENSIFKEYVPSGGVFNYTSGSCADGVITIEDENSTVLHTVNIPSGGAVTQEIADSNVANSDFTYGATILAEGNLILPDITHTNSDLLPVILPAQTPMICTPSTAGINISSLNKTGSASFLTNDDGDKGFGKNANFTTLDQNNKFGNTNRFTDDLGTQVYTSDVVIDWSTYNQVGETVLAYYRVLEVGKAFTVHAGLSPFTKNSLSDWYITNNNELLNIFDYSILRNFTNYTPFNISVVSSTDRIWTSSMESVISTGFYYGRGLSQGNVSANYKVLLRRNYTMAELGL